MMIPTLDLVKLVASAHLASGAPGLPSPEILDRPGWKLYVAHHGSVVKMAVGPSDPLAVLGSGKLPQEHVPYPYEVEVRPLFSVSFGDGPHRGVGICEENRTLVLFGGDLR